MSNELGTMPSTDFGTMPAVEMPLDSSNVAACFAMDGAGCVPAEEASKPLISPNLQPFARGMSSQLPKEDFMVQRGPSPLQLFLLDV